MIHSKLLAWILLATLTNGVALAQSLEDIDAESARQSMERNARHPYLMASSCPYTTTTVTFTPAQTGTGLDEEAVVMTPCGFNPAGPPVPLIVMFNGFCLGTTAIFNGITQIPDEANARGWMVVAIRCGGQALQKKSYGIHKCQPNVELVLDYVIQNYPVDTSRIYGVGWSAGGGGIVSYGARHLDPQRPMFAAIATDAGTYDLTNTYNTVAMDVQNWLKSALMFSGPPLGAALFGYLRSGTLLFNPATLQIDIASSQVRNLIATPILHVYSTDDPITQLPPLNAAFAAYLLNAGAPITSIPFSGLPSPHSWDLLNPVTTLDFLQNHTLNTAPTSFGALCDRDAVYYWAAVKQRTTGMFSRIECATDAAANRVEATMLANVQSVSLSAPAGAFNPNVNFELRGQSSDVDPTQVLIENVAASPTYVLNGSSVSHDWSFDAVNSSLSFDLSGGPTHLLTARYDDYSALLSGPATPKIGSGVKLSLTGNAPNKAFLLLLGLSEGVIPLSLFDPADDRNLLIGTAVPPILVQGVLDGTAKASISFAVPNDPMLIGLQVFNQFVTFPGTLTLADQISNRHDFTIKP